MPYALRATTTLTRDYAAVMEQDKETGAYDTEGAPVTIDAVALLGEPVTFSLHPEDVGPFLGGLGFELQDVARAHDLERHYARRGRRLHVYPACYLAHARVA